MVLLQCRPDGVYLTIGNLDDGGLRGIARHRNKVSGSPEGGEMDGLVIGAAPDIERITWGKTAYGGGNRALRGRDGGRRRAARGIVAGRRHIARCCGPG